MIDIINGLTDQENPYYSHFKLAYQDIKNAIIASSVMALTSDPGHTEKTSVLISRICIENGLKAKVGQKYLLSLRFLNFGNIVILDLVSLDRKSHRDIAYEHTSRMKWLMVDERIGIPVDHYDASAIAPALFIGGSLLIEDDRVKFFGQSGDYGNEFYRGDSNHICEFLAESSRIKLFNKSGRSSEGRDFVKRILEFMLQHKRKRDFYEKFSLELLGEYGRHNYLPLVIMKIFDLYQPGKNSLIELIALEMANFSRFIMAEAIAANLKK